MFIELTSEDKVNDFITTVGAHVLDENGNPISLKPVLPVLVNFITRKDTFPEKHYDYVGESACTFAIQCILSRTYPDSPNNKLRSMALSFQDLGRLADAHLKRVDLDRFVETGHSKDAFCNLLGMLYDLFDSRLVERYIQQSVKELMLNKHPIQEDAVSVLTKLVTSKKGSLGTTYVKVSTVWKATITCKLNPSGVVFTHVAIASSKQKAKAEACQAIIKYLQENPQELERFETQQQVNNQAIQLMIPSTVDNTLHQEEMKNANIREQADSILGRDHAVQPIANQPSPSAIPFGPFTAYSSSKKSLGVFRDIFKNDLTKLRESNTSHDIKGALLTLLNNKPNVTHTTNQSQTGQVHTPIFTVELEVNSGKYTIRTTGAARKKKDAEMQAYQRFARLLIDQDKTEVQ